MYDLTDEEEDALPLPIQWTRGMDLSGDVKYKNLKFGSESEEHPYIIQALNAARKLPLPDGWTVKRTMVTVPEGERGNGPQEEEDYYFYEESTGRSGWDPPQLRECLSQILQRDGFVEAAKRILPEPEPEKQRSEEDEGKEEDNNEGDDITEGDSSNVDWSKLRNALSLEQEEEAVHDEENDFYNSYNSNEEEGSFSPDGGLYRYPSSVASTKSRRSQKWLDIKDHQKSQKVKKSQRSKSSGASVISKRHPEAITFQSVRTLAASVLEDNERIHFQLMELRGTFAEKRNIRCNFLFSNDMTATISNDSDCVHYSQDDIDSLVRLGCSLTSLVVNQPALVVRAISAVSHHDGESRDNSSDVDLMVHIILHRFLHPFSTDNSRTTALLLEALNVEIDRVDWDPLDDSFKRDHDVQSAADSTHHSYSSRLQRNIKVPPCNEQHALLCMLLLGVQETKHVNLFWSPLHRPFLRDYSFKIPSSTLTQDKEFFTPFFQETVLTSLLKCYAMRRDVSLFFRMVWRNVIPAITGLVEGDDQDPTSPFPSRLSPSKDIDKGGSVVTFSKLISIASRIIESALLNEVCVIYPATATAMARCFAEVCGKDGIYTYLLNYLLLPNLVKLLLGDHDCAENEEVYKESFLVSLANKYFNYHEWWPQANSFVENRTSKKIRVRDVAGVLIWCVWRIFSCAIYTEPAELTTFSAAKFFDNIGINETYTEVADTRIRNVVSRMRTKIQKGCECILQLPLDIQASDFLEEPALNGSHVKVHTKAMGTLLNKRINDLMLKPEEMVNAVVISRHDSIFFFDALAYVLEDLQSVTENYMTTAPDSGIGGRNDGNDLWRPDFDATEALHDIQGYLALCDTMDGQLVEAMGSNEVEVEDIILFWKDPPYREEAEDQEYYNGDSSFNSDNEDYCEETSILPPVDLDAELEMPVLPMPRSPKGEEIQHFESSEDMPPYPFEDEAYQLHRERKVGNYLDETDGGLIDDDDIFDDVTMFSDIPPPPEGAPVDSVEYQYDQLCRGALLQKRYMASLSAMLGRIRNDTPCTLTSLLMNDLWFYSPEVDISHRLAVDHNNIFDKCTSSTLLKSKPSSQGAVLPRDIKSRLGHTQAFQDRPGLAVIQQNFFNSLRFSDARPRAGTRTSVDINTNRNAPRLVNNMIRQHLISKHDPDHGFDPAYEKIYHDSHGRRTDPVLESGRANQPRNKPRYTKVTLPQNSSLLVPTVSLSCKPSTRQPLSKIHKSYINSLRSPEPPTRNKKPKARVPKKRVQPGTSVISPTRPLKSFPEHLRSRVRRNPSQDEVMSSPILQTSLQRQNSLFSLSSKNDSDYYEFQKYSGKNDFHGQMNRMNQYGSAKYHRDNTAPVKTKERKMPVPLHGAQDNLLTATISHAMKLESNNDEFEITAEQEKGWIAQLRTWEALGSSFQGGVISEVPRRPFFPSGQVVPIRLENQRRRVPEHLTPGKNRRQRRKSRRDRNAFEDSCPEDENQWNDYQPSNSYDSVAKGKESSFDEYNYVPQRRNEHDEQKSCQQDSVHRQNNDEMTFCSETDSNKLRETLKLLQLHARGRDNLHEEVSDVKDQTGETSHKEPSMSSDCKEKTLSSMAYPDGSLEQGNFEDPYLRDVSEQTEGVLARLKMRLQQKNNAMDQQDSSTSDDHDSDEAEKNESDVHVVAHETPEHSELLDKSVISKPDQHENLSSYSFHATEMHNHVIERPQEIYKQHFKLLTQEEENQQMEEFLKHQKECENLSPTEIQGRAISVTKNDGEEGELFREEQQNENNPPPNEPTAPERAASVTSNHSTRSNVPLIAKQHSVSTLAKREKLMEGYEVMKYADVGYGKKKLLNYEPSSQQLQWRPLHSSVFSRFRGKKQEDAKSIFLRDVLEVRRGISSSALRKAGLIDPLCSLTILTNQMKDGKPRTLDVVFKEKSDRDAFVRTMEIILQQLGHHSVEFL